MADERFDLSYRGLIAPGADPEHTRQRLTAIFKLSDAGADRLFTGKPVVVKRDVDPATAAQFEKVFAQAGAVLTVTPSGMAEARGHPTHDRAAAVADPSEAGPLSVSDGSQLALAPMTGFLETPLEVPFPELDLSYLTLVPGYDWTLEDCAPPPTPIPQLDMGYLSLEPLPQAEPGTDSRLD
jgi:hypothetical protein